ncbi:hypothetical protein RirG_239720 [Rhizophagus irregularis DAOM 197198w]|uniref:DUF6570 domain-containing protein n=1 Tax=Rhizophagus irregularis (strain DAOM 197198w) TaxID=1432141 RepID=A0A015LG96_RHIIW|nr:hypothetical protein RirG_239720 [Rhizophagus irregularis DAOM 197198w]
MDEQREKRLSYYRERRKYLKNIQNTMAQDLNSQQKNLQQKYQDSGVDGAEGDGAEDDGAEDNGAEDGADTHTDAGVLGEFERDLLKKFRNKVNKFKHSLCTTCNENFPSIVIIRGECRRCHKEKQPKKFSKDNNMDPGEVPDELRDLTEIEEMLVARVFPVMSVYRLRGDVLVIRRQSASNAEAFRNFKVRRDKVTQALIWLKQNNRYYADVIIDHEILQFLPIDGTIDDQLQDINEDIDYDESEDDVITRTFVPLPLPANREDTAIRNTLDRIQNENHHIMWPQINGNPVNEFQTPGYIACAFPTLYPTGSADLRAERIRDIKPAEYFRHLLQYKNGRFARHARWRYFALNS